MPKKGDRRNLNGMRFGRLFVESEADPIIVNNEKRSRKYYRWNCICDCGNICIVKSCDLLAGKVSSCGCLEKDARHTNHRTHGLSKTRLYHIYTGIKTRCYNENDSHYHSYGGRGIKMCDEWLNDFKAFYDWAMENGYDPNAETGSCTIDRIDVDGDYSPCNCRFVSMLEQSYNKTTNRLIEYDGEMMPVSKVANLVGVSEKTIFSRIYRKQDPLKDIRKTRRTHEAS